MNKIIVALILLTVCNPLLAQKSNVRKAFNYKEAGKLQEAVEAIQKAIDPSNDKSEKSIDWPHTYEVKGEIYQAVFRTEDEKIKELSEDPLTEALNSYKKALELDSKGSFKNSLKVKLTLLSNDLINQSVNEFKKGDYDKALKHFEQILDIQSIDIINEDNPEAVDTAIIFNAGLAALNSENYDKAIKYYSQAAKYDYNGGITYTYLANAYQLKKDTLGALKILQEGFGKYPQDKDVLNSLIQIYLDQDQTGEAMKYLDMAMKKDPDNATYYFIQGTLYEKTDQYDKAIASYQKSIDVDNKYFNSCYNMGVLYYSKGVKQVDVANSVPQADNERFKKEVAIADEWFRKALPYIEKCHEIKPDDPGTKELLKTVYYRLNMMDKYELIRDS